MVVGEGDVKNDREAYTQCSIYYYSDAVEH